MTKLQLITITIAAWGAALSTWNSISAWRKDRNSRRIKVTCNVAMVDGYSRPFLMWMVTNAGSEPVTILKLGARLDNGKYWEIETQPTTKLPRELKQGEFFLEGHVLQENATTYKSLWAIDSLGTRHLADRSTVRSIRLAAFSEYNLVP